MEFEVDHESIDLGDYYFDGDDLRCLAPHLVIFIYMNGEGNVMDVSLHALQHAPR